MSVRYTPRSLQDLENIRRTISKDNPSAAWIVASFIRRTIRNLEHWSYQGRATEKENVRRLAVSTFPYVVYYLVRADQVVVLNTRPCRS